MLSHPRRQLMTEPRLPAFGKDGDQTRSPMTQNRTEWRPMVVRAERQDVEAGAK